VVYNSDMKPLRLYLDTSVLGGCFDEEFSVHSNRVIEGIHHGRIVAVLGELVGFELKKAPANVKDLLKDLPPEYVEEVAFTQEASRLREAYLKAGILTPNASTDAGHVATATVYRVDAIVSWNFKHIVQLEKMKLYNQVNLSNGYGFLQIVSPREVLNDEKD